MKKLQIIFTILLFSSAVYSAEKHKEVVTYRLDSKRLFPIATYFKKGVTTVMFPGQIEGIAAGNVAMNKVHHKINGSPACDFLLSFQPGNYYFSIRALKNAVSGTVNVVYARNTYILKFQENENNAMSTVNFSDNGENGDDSERDSNPPSTAVLKGLMDKAKSFDMLKKKYPGAVSQVTVCDNKCISKYKDYNATVLKCWRFNNYNSLVFLVELKNKTNKTLLYNPDKCSFAVEEEYLLPVAFEATGIIPANSTALTFFVISNTPDGRKNKFAADNQWEIVIKAVKEEAK